MTAAARCVHRLRLAWRVPLLPARHARAVPRPISDFVPRRGLARGSLPLASLGTTGRGTFAWRARGAAPQKSSGRPRAPPPFDGCAPLDGRVGAAAASPTTKRRRSSVLESAALSLLRAESQSFGAGLARPLRGVRAALGLRVWVRRNACAVKLRACVCLLAAVSLGPRLLGCAGTDSRRPNARAPVGAASSFDAGWLLAAARRTRADRGLVFAARCSFVPDLPGWLALPGNPPMPGGRGRAGDGRPLPRERGAAGRAGRAPRAREGLRRPYPTTPTSSERGAKDAPPERVCACACR